jgi:hypothetical protein
MVKVRLVAMAIFFISTAKVHLNSIFPAQSALQSHFFQRQQSKIQKHEWARHGMELLQRKRKTRQSSCGLERTSGIIFATWN